MSDKAKKVVGYIGWGATVVGVVLLIIDGVKAEDINAATLLIKAAIVAIGDALAFIFGKAKK